MYSIREFRQEDAAPLIRILEKQRAATGYPRLSLDIPNLLDWMVAPDDSFNKVIVDASIGEEPIGHVAASAVFKTGSNTERLVRSLASENRLPWIEIKRLFVAYQRQRGGIGAQLFNNALEESYRLNYAPFVVVEAENGLAEWYIKHGGRIREKFSSVNDGSGLFFIDFPRPLR